MKRSIRWTLWLTLSAVSIGVIIVASTMLSANGRVKNSVRAGKMRAMIKKLNPLQQPMGKPRPGDWLLSHDEPGQTFNEYLGSDPVTATGKRGTIYVQPIGEFTRKQREIVDLTAEFLQHYFSLPVKVQPDMPLSVIPAEARRTHPTWGVDQILSTHVLDEVLVPDLPNDAAARIAFTAVDLWPGEGWNFVFGQASLQKRVGVWSIARNGDAESGEDEFRLCLLRTIKTAGHETGHMFSIQHCIAYECNMCGGNNREESDRRPLHLCSQCEAKVSWATSSDATKRFQALAEFCKKHGFIDEAKYYEGATDALKE